MYPEIHLGPLTLQTFGLMFALAFLAAGALVAKRLGEIGKPVDWAYEMGFAALVGGVVGSRVYFVVQNYDSVKDDLLGNLFSGSGLVWYGGAIGGALAVLLWAWYRDFLGLALLDLAAPALALGYAIGRCGCQLSGDGDYGKAWDGPWAMSYPDGTVPTDRTVHPTPIYETLAMGLGAWILWQLRDRFRAGVLFAIYLVYAGAERFLVEFIRRNSDVALGLTAAQLESLAMMVVGVDLALRGEAAHGTLSREAAAAEPLRPEWLALRTWKSFEVNEEASGVEAVETGSGGGADAATVGELLDAATEKIAAAGCEEPRGDAEALVADALGIGVEELSRDGAGEASPEVVAAIEAAVARRADHEPLAYVLGRAPFRELEIAVDPRVLWPRRETELLVEVGAELPEGARVHEVGTGSGAIALALLSERPDLRVTASDLSPEAAEAARENAERLGLELEVSVAEGLPEGLRGTSTWSSPTFPTSPTRRSSSARRRSGASRGSPSPATAARTASA